jgi:drug/metabolite transporter (DMT)-like permease
VLTVSVTHAGRVLHSSRSLPDGRIRGSDRLGVPDRLDVPVRLGVPDRLGVPGGPSSVARDLAARGAVAAAAAVTVLLWGSAFVAIRVALPALGAPALSLSRLLLASLALVALARVLRVGLPPRASLVRILACGAAGMTAYQVLLNTGEVDVPAGTASLLVGTAPLFASGLARLALGERMTRRATVGMAVGFSGAAVIALGRGHGLRLDAGALLVLGAAAAQAGFFVLQKPLLDRHSAAEVTCWSMVAGTLLALPLAGTLRAWAVPVTHGPRAAALLAVTFLALAASALGFTTWAYAQARLSVAAAAGTLYAVPVVAFTVGWLVLGEAPSPVTLIGGAIALVGVVLSRGGRTRTP